MPRALESGPTVAIEVRPIGPARPYALRRVEITPRAGERQPAAGDGPVYAWLVVSAGEDTLPGAARVHQYLGFVRRLRHQAVYDPRRGLPSESSIAGGAVQLVDDRDGRVVLEVGGAPEDGAVHVFNRAAGLHVTITAAEAALLVPAATVFRDTSGVSPFRTGRP
jgi:hypothetical protein